MTPDWYAEISGDNPLFFLDIPAGTATVDLFASGSSGDVDLYATWDEPPTATSYQYAAATPGTSYENLVVQPTVQLPARLYVLADIVVPLTETAYLDASVLCGDTNPYVLLGGETTCPGFVPDGPPDDPGPGPAGVCNGRYQVLEAGSTMDCSYSCDGSGRVLDTDTGFTWTARPATVFVVGETTLTEVQAACPSGMRLPSLAEYQAVFGTKLDGTSNYCAEAFPDPSPAAFTTTLTSIASGDGLYDYTCHIQSTGQPTNCINRVSAHCLK